MDELKAEGFIILRNVISDFELHTALSCYNVTVNYENMKQFVDRTILTANQHVSIGNSFTKFRFSDNNNKDASLLHRDVYNHTNSMMYMYTCLCYFDESEMELIPKSHAKASLFQCYSNMTRFKLYPGDVLIMYANLMHRGIFHNKQRRLLKIFQISLNI